MFLSKKYSGGMTGIELRVCVSVGVKVGRVHIYVVGFSGSQLFRVHATRSDRVCSLERGLRLVAWEVWDGYTTNEKVHRHKMQVL